MEPGAAPAGAGLRRTGRRLGLFGLYSRCCGGRFAPPADRTSPVTPVIWRFCSNGGRIPLYVL